MPNNPNGPSQDEKNDKKDIKKLGSENMTVELSSLSFSLSLSLSLSLSPSLHCSHVVLGSFHTRPHHCNRKVTEREREILSPFQ